MHRCIDTRFVVAHADGIVPFAGYPYPERQSDGYFQRVQMVDRLLTGRWRIYIDSDELSPRTHWFDRPEPQVLHDAGWCARSIGRPASTRAIGAIILWRRSII